MLLSETAWGGGDFEIENMASRGASVYKGGTIEFVCRLTANEEGGP